LHLKSDCLGWRILLIIIPNRNYWLSAELYWPKVNCKNGLIASAFWVVSFYPNLYAKRREANGDPTSESFAYNLDTLWTFLC